MCGRLAKWNDDRSWWHDEASIREEHWMKRILPWKKLGMPVLSALLSWKGDSVRMENQYADIIGWRWWRALLEALLNYIKATFLHVDLVILVSDKRAQCASYDLILGTWDEPKTCTFTGDWVYVHRAIIRKVEVECPLCIPQSSHLPVRSFLQGVCINAYETFHGGDSWNGWCQCDDFFVRCGFDWAEIIVSCIENEHTDG